MMKESIFNSLKQDIENGIKGENKGINIGLPKLGRYANLRRHFMILLFSTTGAGKSALSDYMMLNACKSYIDNPMGLKPKFILFSMERAAKLRITKWISYFIFQDTDVEIQVPKILGWWGEKLSPKEHELVLKYEEYINLLLSEYIDIYDGAKTPKEIWKIMKDTLEENGEYKEEKVYNPTLDTYKTYKKYYYNNNNLVIIPIIDHGNLTKTTQELPSKKSAIDKLVTMMQEFRDNEGCCVIWVSQVNRAISGVSRTKDGGEHELTNEDVKESGDIVDATDLSLALFDPAKYKQTSKTGYDPIKFIDKSNGNNNFRSIQVLKSSYGSDGVRIPLAFNGFCGEFAELPKKIDLTDKELDELYTNVINKKYFKQKQ